MNNNIQPEVFDKDRLSEYIYNEIQNNQVNRDLSNEDLLAKITSMVRNDAPVSVSISEQTDVIDTVYNQIRGLGLLDSIIKDDDITEVMINGHNNIFIEKKGRIQVLDQEFENEAKLREIINRLVGVVGREATEADPIIDARLLDGSRVNIVLPPIAMDGSTVTIRKFSKEPMTIDKLISYKSITEEHARIINQLVRSKYNIFICGGTGSGKTTFLNACSNYIPSDERIITIEDSAELQIVNVPNIARLEARRANSSGVGEITIKDLIKSSLRMRPDRIVVGEVRGSEALDMLQAMNTGHDGSLSTGHANSAVDMLARLETMVLQGASGLPLAAIRSQIASGIDIIIHLSRLRDKSRKTMEITEMIGLDKDANYILNPLFKFEEDDNSTIDKVSGSLVRTKNKLIHNEKLLQAGIKEVF